MLNIFKKKQKPVILDGIHIPSGLARFRALGYTRPWDETIISVALADHDAGQYEFAAQSARAVVTDQEWRSILGHAQSGRN